MSKATVPAPSPPPPIRQSSYAASPGPRPLSIAVRGHSKNFSSGSGFLGSSGPTPSGLEASIQRSRSERKVPDAGWLQVKAEDVGAVKATAVPASLGAQQAADVLIKTGQACLLVETAPDTYAFFDYADLNAFLLLVLRASASESISRSASRSGSSKSPLDTTGVDTESAIDERDRDVLRLLRRGDTVGVGAVCDLSDKNPFMSYPSHTTLRTLLPIFASGVHRIALTHDGSPDLHVLTDLALLQYLVRLPNPPSDLLFTVTEAQTPLNPLICLPASASVLDAMQIMSLNGLTGLGVLSGAGLSRSRSRTSTNSQSPTSDSSSSSKGRASPMQAMPTMSPVLMPVREESDLLSVVTVQDCAKMVIPSQGREVLSMGLDELVRAVQVNETGGRERGEEKLPVHTVSLGTSLLYASKLILATSSSRIFVRRDNPLSTPPLSPVPSLSTSQSSPLSSPSLTSLSLNDTSLPGLPPAPSPQLSPHFVLSVVDILGSLAAAHHLGADPARGLARRRRASSFTIKEPNAQPGLASWRWVGVQGV